MRASARVLVVDDDLEGGEGIAAFVRQMKHTAVFVRSAEEALHLLASQAFDLVLTDLQMRAMDGIALCARLAGAQPDVAVIVFTGHSNLESAVRAIRAGAYDFLTKPLNVDTLQFAIDRALERSALVREVRRLRDAAGGDAPARSLVGSSRALREMTDLIARVATTDATVLITGESGTGKELVARAIHARGARAKGPFVAINCAAVPGPLFESELFGHVRGAFTDARSARGGLFVEADEGTLFLDEIGEVPLDVQSKLLRALQERAVRPVGGNQEVPFNARVITATNRDLEAAVRAKRFREDLYYRIAVVNVEVPTLRARGDDVPVLAQHFVTRFAARFGKEVLGIHPAALARMMAYAWPGNVRELENSMERAVALARFDHVTVDDLPERVRDYAAEAGAPAGVIDDVVPLAEYEQRYVRRVLSLLGGDRSQAARLLRVDRKALARIVDTAPERLKAPAEA
jgi:DNA-binding NtrC family response regulator